LFTFRKNGHFYEKVGKKGEPICIDNEIPFEIPDSWEYCRLNSIGNIIGGGTPKTQINEYWENGDIPWLTPADMKYVEGKYVSQGARNITKLGLNKSSAQLIPKNSIIYSSRAPIGYIAISNNKLSTNQGFKSFVPINLEIVDYMYYCLISFTDEIKSRASGTTFKEISKTKFGETIIPIPPINEQKRIVKKIEELLPIVIEYGNLREKLDNLNSEFPDKLKSSILQDAIQGKLVPQDSNDEPASVLLEKIRDEKERLIKEKKIKRNKNESYIFKENNHFYEKIGKEVVDITNDLPFEIPGNWMWCKLENITSNIHYGYTASAQEVGDVRLLRITDIHENNVNWDSVPYCVISEDKLANYILRNRDIVMARTGGTIGKSYIINNLNKKAVFASYLIRIIPLKNINENYLKQFFESPLFWSQLRDNTKGTGQPNVNAKSLKNLLIPIPPFIEQEIIVNKIEKIFNEINLRLKV